MPQVILDTTRTATRFIEYTGATRTELLEVLNATHEGMASVVAMGQAQDGSWYAVLDRALKVILTMEDVIGMQQKSEIEDSSDKVLKNSKLNMSA